MYKVIHNGDDLQEWIKLLPNEISVIWHHFAVRNLLEEIVATIDRCYGENRDIRTDLGGFTIVVYGDNREVSSQFQNILKHFNLNIEEYEHKDFFEYNEPERTLNVTFWLYLCSSDYAVYVVTVTEKENEYE